MKFNLAVLPGDGIGPEVLAEGVKALEAVGKRFGHSFELTYGLIGGVAIDKEGTALSAATLKMCKKQDAVIFGAVGDPKYDDPMAKVHPEDGLLLMRKVLDTFANLRPVKLFPELIEATPLKTNIVKGTDFVVVRELTGGLYFGKPKKQWMTSRGRKAVDTMVYSEQEIERIVRVGFELARKRRKKLTSVDKANVLLSSRLWRQVTMEISKEYPDIAARPHARGYLHDAHDPEPQVFRCHRYGKHLRRYHHRRSFYADRLDGDDAFCQYRRHTREGGRVMGYYEPIHGSAPKHAGKNEANPVATILSVAMLLRYSLALEKEASVIEVAVEDMIKEGYRTYDIMSAGMKKLGTREMGDVIARKVDQ